MSISASTTSLVNAVNDYGSAAKTKIDSMTPQSEIGAANGVASLDAAGEVPAAQLKNAPVQSVAGRTGAVTLSASDVSGLATVATSGSYGDLANKPSIPTNTSQLTNDSGYITASGAPVQSVAGKTGTVTLASADVGLGNVDNTADVNKSVANATTWNGSHQTISTAAPSGGANGDLWFQYS